MNRTSRMQVLKIRGGRANLLLLVQERNIGVLPRKGFKDKAAAIRAKARVNHFKVRDISGHLANKCREHVSIATSLET